ncbi:MAG TPA: DUF2238 domain-containing protein [Acidimicrobiales bacterium]
MTDERRRAPISAAETAAVAIVAVAIVGFAVYGVATGAPSTVGYLTSVVLVGGLVFWLRREQLPPFLAIALAVDAVAHLAGGMIAVGDSVLYDASVGPWFGALDTHLFQYDHLVHAYGSMVATVALWVLLVPPEAKPWARRNLVLLCVLAGMGIGAVNEAIEFVATLAHSGDHVGGYTNTGWDLIANFVGAALGAVVIARMPAPAPAA